uniref:Uncharacterized protein n=1 Tax=Helianthus annuus TaxID=4232 RepID=A0A251UM35_HELAN
MRISGFLIFEFPFLSPKNPRLIVASPTTHPSRIIIGLTYSSSLPAHHSRFIYGDKQVLIYWNGRLLLLIGMKQKLVTSYQPHLLVKCCRGNQSCFTKT